MKMIKLISSVFPVFTCAFFFAWADTYCFNANAQIRGDSSVSTQDVSMVDSNYIVSGGEQTGQNLYYSFRDFSVPRGTKVTFADEYSGVSNIFSRVTGRSPSYINGLIDYHGESASFFLINPNGIIFGPESALNVSGSFIATTADGILFADGNKFGVDWLSDSSTLSIDIPIGLQFGADPGSIAVRTQTSLSFPDIPDAPEIPIGLRTSENSTLALLGSGISVEGDTNAPVSSALISQGGRIELGSVGSNEFLDLEKISVGWDITYDSVDIFDDVEISRGVLAVGTGEIEVFGDDIFVTDGSQVGQSSFGPDQANNVSIVADGLVEVSKSSGLIAETSGTGDGAGGNISIKADELNIREGASVSSAGFGIGDSGNIVLDISKSILIEGATDGSSTADVIASTRGTGNAGRVDIQTGSLILSRGGQIFSDTFGSGSGGDINVHADTVEVFGQGQIIDPNTNEVIFRSSGIFSRITPFASGDGGQVDIQSPQLTIRDGGVISTETFQDTTGSAGDISVVASELLLIRGPDSGLITTSNNFEPAGNLSMNIGNLKIQDGGEISVSNKDIGNGGSLRLNARNILLENESSISAETLSGNGGDINVEVMDSLRLRDGSSISTKAGQEEQAVGNGGDIFITTKFLTAVPEENSDIVADAFGGRGGNVNVQAEGIFGIKPRETNTEFSDITASSQSNVDGTITINSPDAETDRDSLEEPNSAPPPNVVSDCRAGRIRTASSFVDIGRGGLPPDPAQSLGGTAVWEDLRPVVTSRSPSAVSSNYTPKPPQSQPAIVEAQGWIVNEAGEIVLTEEAPHAIASKRGFRDRTCRPLPQDS
ncbi:MAG: S-layer family protein [Cyanobacteria bacterium P01_F01_bin.33]